MWARRVGGMAARGHPSLAGPRGRGLRGDLANLPVACEIRYSVRVRRTPMSRSPRLSFLPAITLRVSLGLAAAASVLAVASPPALAAPVDKRELEARADFAAGRYQKAVDTFAQLFADTGDPLYLRNIGRCYQKMKRTQEAIDSFQEYLLKGKNLSKSERQEIEGYIKEMQALKASEAPPPAPVVTPPAPPPVAAPPPAPLAPMPVVPLGATGAPATGGDGRSWRIAGIATAAGGVALIAVGIGVRRGCALGG